MKENHQYTGPGLSSDGFRIFESDDIMPMPSSARFSLGQCLDITVAFKSYHRLDTQNDSE